MWTNEQQHAIDVRDKNILVSAAAGSGKTAVLVERIINLIKQGEIRTDRLLITTFTVAAAGEIRERILKSLTACLNENPNDGLIAEQVAMFERASIGTIHSFCQNLLRNNFYRTPLPADFRLADTAELELLKEEVLDEVIENEYEKGDDIFLRFAEGYCRGKDDSALRALVKEIHAYSEATSDPVEWLEWCKSRYEMGDMTPSQFLAKSWGGEYIKTMLPLFEIYFDGYAQLLEQAKVEEGYEKFPPLLINEVEMIKNLYEVIKAADWDSIREALQQIKFESLPTRKRTTDNRLKDKVAAHRQAVKDAIADWTKNIFIADAQTICNETLLAGSFVKCLCDIVIKFYKEYSQAKLEKGWLAFADLEHYTIKLLREHGDELRSRYDALMIDEFQDTNEAQAEIFKNLSNGKNLFVVGDIKQCIYRFRNAQPQMFARMDRDYEENPDHGENIYLAKNFRCSGAVVDFTNCIFKNVMNKHLGEIDYGSKESLIRGGSKENDGFVEINIIEKKFNPDSVLTEDDLMTDSMQREAMLVARRIYRLVEEEKALIYDKALDCMRPVEYRDITILSRNKKRVSTVFSQAVADLGIPVYCEETGSYFSTTEISFIIALLRVIDNPLQDVELLAVLRSPVFAFDDDDLAQLRSEDKHCSVYDLLKKSPMPKAAEALGRINGYIDFAEFATPAEIINHILNDTDYESIVCAMPNSSVRLMNIQLLRERADDYSRTTYASLGDFLSYVMTKSRLGDEYKTASETSSNENAVTVMHIHKSKGLEFPVVFLVDTGKQFNKRECYNSILYDIDVGMGMDVIDCDKRLRYPNISGITVSDKLEANLLSEEMRILYVGLTRTISNLYIYGSPRTPIEKAKVKWESAPEINGKVPPYTVAKQLSLLDWIMIGNRGEGAARVHYHTAEETLGVADEPLKVLGFENIVKDEVNDNTIRLMDQRFSYKYAYADAVNLPSKLSVSELLDSREHKAELAKADFSKETAGALSGAQRGNIIHFILQSIDLANTDSLPAVAEQINSMAERGQITADALKAADADLIYRFLSSPDGKRMKDAFELHREYQFVAEFDAKELTDTTADEKILLQGVIDCWFEEDGEVVIYDYKTGNVDIHSKRYKAQLDLYKKSLERILGKKVKECVICELD